MSANQDTLSQIPFLGSGMGFRREVKNQMLEHHESIDFVEIITEQYIDKPLLWQELEEIGEYFRVIPHGIRLSIGSDLPIDMDHLRGVKKVCQITKTPFYSEHLCMTKAPGIDIGHLSPLWYTEDVLNMLINNVNQVQDYLEIPLILENVTYAFDLPNPQMPQAEFFNRLVDATGCGILLDITNVYINSVNHDFDGEKFLDDMPLDKVVQLHLAGGFMSGDQMIDGHSEPVQEGSWELLRSLASRQQTVKGCILEQDSNFPEEISGLLETLQKARDIMAWPSVPPRQDQISQVA